MFPITLKITPKEHNINLGKDLIRLSLTLYKLAYSDSLAVQRLNFPLFLEESQFASWKPKKSHDSRFS